MFFFLIFINIYHVITRVVVKIKDLDLEYIHPITLLNGNIFIIHKNGVLVYNYNFTNILYNNNFGGIPIISSEEESELTSVIQCKDNGKYVIGLINDTFYVFSSQGQYLFDKQINLFTDFRTDIYFKYFSFLYYKCQDSNYSFIVSFINNERNIKFVKIKANIEQQNCESEIFFYNINKPISDSVSCQIINFNDFSDKLVCVYAEKVLINNGFNQNEENKVKVSLFDPEDNFKILKQSSIDFFNIDEHYIFKSVIPDKYKGLLFADFVIKSQQNLNYIIFDLNKFNIIGGIKSTISCSGDTKLLMADYFEYTKQYIFSCLNTNGVSMYKFKFNDSKTDNFPETVYDETRETISYDNCNYFYNFKFIFLLYEGSYFLINNFNCNNSKVQIYNLNTVLEIKENIIPSDEPDNSYLSSPTLPKTTHIKIPTTIPKTTHIKIPTTIPKTTHIKILTTIPKTTHIKIPTTIPKTTHINSLTTAPKLELSTIPSTTISTILINRTTIKKIDTIISTKATLRTTQINTIPTTILKTIHITTPPTEKECQIKCSKCNNDFLNLCIQCNTEKKYYPTVPIEMNGINYYECYNQETVPSGYYLDNYIYKPCYSRCKTCNYQGNDDVNNCTSCKKNYIFRPDEENSTNCVTKCPYYYYIFFEQYLCTENNQCPLEASLLIRARGQCINNCKNDKEYKSQYNYECVRECPEDYLPNENNICEIKNKKKCYLYNDFFKNVNFNSLESNNFDILIKKYITGFNESDFHVDFYQSQNYSITIYKTMECLKELEMDSSIIDFNDCYKKIQEKYNLENRNLIILIADFFNEKKLVDTKFYFFNPDSGVILSIEETCANISFTIEKSLNYYQEVNIEEAKFFDDQNINIFNSSDVFYNDLCYFFKSPNGKDVPLKVRLQLFYPNISFCEEGCNNIGVNLTSMKAICECKLKDLLSKTEDVSKFMGLDFEEFFESISLDVIRCYKTLFQFKYFIRCYGGLIAILLILAQTICVIIAGKVSMGKIKIITYWIIENYINVLKSKITIQSPPKKKIKKNKVKNNKNNSLVMNYSENSNAQNESKYKLSQKPILKTNNEKLILDKYNKGRKFSKFKVFKINEKKLEKKENKLINLEEYLMTSLDDLDYDETIIREKRNICKIFIEKLIVNQMIVDLFYNNNWIIPKTIKIIFFIVRIDLYLFVNALFYNEKYITELYFSNKKEKFFSFIPRSLNRIFYASAVSTVLDFIISLLFPSENKIKKILLKKKYIKEMKNKIIIAIKKIINNYWIFIGISYFFTIITWFYVSCFNNVYPYLKIEWIKSSIFIIIILQFISIINCLLYAVFRFISIKCRSEKIFKFSNYLFS